MNKMSGGGRHPVIKGWSIHGDAEHWGGHQSTHTTWRLECSSASSPNIRANHDNHNFETDGHSTTTKAEDDLGKAINFSNQESHRAMLFFFFLSSSYDIWRRTYLCLWFNRRLSHCTAASLYMRRWMVGVSLLSFSLSIRVVTKITENNYFFTPLSSTWIFVLIPPYVPTGRSQISPKMSSDRRRPRGISMKNGVWERDFFSNQNKPQE